VRPPLRELGTDVTADVEEAFAEALEQGELEHEEVDRRWPRRVHKAAALRRLPPVDGHEAFEKDAKHLKSYEQRFRASGLTRDKNGDLPFFRKAHSVMPANFIFPSICFALLCEFGCLALYCSLAIRFSFC